MFCEVLTLKEFEEYVSPVPAVVVAVETTAPFMTARPPFERAGRLRVPEMVEEAVEKKPPSKPMTDEVEL